MGVAENLSERSIAVFAGPTFCLSQDTIVAAATLMRTVTSGSF